MNIEDVLKGREDIMKFNAAEAPYILKRNGISFESKNDCIHIVLSHNDNIVDLCPSTGLWIVRNDGSREYGIHNLIKFLKGD